MTTQNIFTLLKKLPAEIENEIFFYIPAPNPVAELIKEYWNIQTIREYTFIEEIKDIQNEFYDNYYEEDDDDLQTKNQNLIFWVQQLATLILIVKKGKITPPMWRPILDRLTDYLFYDGEEQKITDAFLPYNDLAVLGE